MRCTSATWRCRFDVAPGCSRWVSNGGGALTGTAAQTLAKFYAKKFNEYNPPKKVLALLSERRQVRVDMFVCRSILSRHGSLSSSTARAGPCALLRSTAQSCAARVLIAARSCGVEKFIDGPYRKHNNNYGYVSEEERNTPQAFSHFTYEVRATTCACRSGLALSKSANTGLKSQRAHHRHSGRR